MQSRFWNDERGNFALISAAAALPVVMAVGIAVDFSTLVRTKRDLQNATDAAALAVASGGKDISNANARAMAHTYVVGNFDGPISQFDLKRDGPLVNVSAKAKAPLAFAGLFGYDLSTVGVSSTADIATASYEIALVLDTTGSMAGGKLASMKDAVVGLIDVLSDQIEDEQKLKFATVPFATFVNVGPQFAPSFDKKGKLVKNTGAPWLDLKGDSPIKQTELAKGVSRFELFHNLDVAWAGCVETREPTKKAAHDVQDTPARAKDKNSLFVPALSIDEPATPGYQNDYIVSDVDPLDKSLLGLVKKLKKYGFVALDLVGDDDDSTDNEWQPVAATITAKKGPNRGCDMQPITPLSTDYATLRTKVSTMVASGTTNIMEGVAWGWRVLSPAQPFAEGADPKKNPDLNKIMIVLTDGANNFGVRSSPLQSEYSSFGFLVDARLAPVGASAATTNAAMNEKTLAACTNAKANGIEIYTIRLEEPDKATGTMLQQCASGPDHFFDAPSRNQLDEVFGAIAKKIVRIRLAS